MTIEIKKNADELVLEITGRLDTITAPALEKTINENLVKLKTLSLILRTLNTFLARDFVFYLALKRK